MTTSSLAAGQQPVRYAAAMATKVKPHKRKGKAVRGHTRKKKKKGHHKPDMTRSDEIWHATAMCIPGRSTEKGPNLPFND